MKLRKLILSLVLFTNAFAHNAALTSSSFQTSQLKTNVGFTQPTARNTSGFDPAYHLSLPKPVQDKNFYLLSLFQRNQQARRLLSRNKALRQLAKDKMLALKKASRCDNMGCFDDLIRFNGPTVDSVAAELQRLANRPQLKRLASNDLRPSGVFIKYYDQPDDQMLVAAWLK